MKPRKAPAIWVVLSKGPDPMDDWGLLDVRWCRSAARKYVAGIGKGPFRFRIVRYVPASPSKRGGKRRRR